MSSLENFYNEHATQARQHEEQRERMTNIILATTTVLVGLITFSELSIWSLSASITIVILGIFGFYFAGKHYERYRYHYSIMSEITSEIDQLSQNPNTTGKKLDDIRSSAEITHYANFRWPDFAGTNNNYQKSAKSWIARRRVHVFWEIVHILVAIIGFSLSLVIVIKQNIKSEKIIKVEIVTKNED